MHREAPLVRVECGEPRRAADVADPGPGLDSLRHLGDRAVGHAEDDQLAALLEQPYAALPQAAADGRARAAGPTDHGDAVEHRVGSSSVADTGLTGVYSARPGWPRIRDRP